MPSTELQKHFTCANTGKRLQDPVLIFKEREWTAVERDSVQKSAYKGPVYEPYLKEAIRRWRDNAPHPLTQKDISRTSVSPFNRIDVTRLQFMLIGNSKTGKSQLVNRLMRDSFQPSYDGYRGSSQDSTTISVDHHLVRVNIWDIQFRTDNFKEGELPHDKWFNNIRGIIPTIILTCDITKSKFRLMFYICKSRT